MSSFFRAQVVETSGGGVSAASLYCKTFNQKVGMESRSPYPRASHQMEHISQIASCALVVRSGLQEHVAILLKGTEGQLSLAIKCTAASLAQELAQDAQTALPSL